MWIVAAAVLLGMFGLLGVYVALERGRSPLEGLVLGLLYGPLGVIVCALLPLGELVQAPGNAAVPEVDESLPAMFRARGVPELPAEPPRKATPPALRDLKL